ncbi:MAG: GDSL-type esterase/lipase family protein [Akkermansiaceae bacterium]|jgi:hypothetical protein|nr:GDSL-type esterase/lipase family protein [Akkermansiaceae bacterium]
MTPSFRIRRLAPFVFVASLMSASAQLRVLPLGDSITAGALGGPNSPEYDRSGYRYFLERYLQGSEGGLGGFSFGGAASGGTIAAFAGQWFGGAKPLYYPLHSGYPGYSIGQIRALVNDGTVPIATTDIALLQIGTNNVSYGSAVPATPAEIAAWKVEYETLLDAILAKSATVKVIMAKIPPVANGSVIGNLAANAARIEPFNQQVVAVVHAAYAAAHPGRFFLVDHYSLLDPLNFDNYPGFDTVNNTHDFFTGLGDGVHPYNGGHRKFAGSWWQAIQVAEGAAAARLVTPFDDPDKDGVAGADIGLTGAGAKRNGVGTGGGTEVFDQPYILASANPGSRAKFYVKLDLSGLPKNWDEARLGFVFWGAPGGNPDWGNCTNNMPSAGNYEVYGIADGGDAWTETSITWANAPGNAGGGNGSAGTLLGNLVVPAGASSGDIVSISGAALRDFVNTQRGGDGMVTFVVVGTTSDPGVLVTFQDSDFRDYAPPFLQLSAAPEIGTPPELKILSKSFNVQANPAFASLTFSSAVGHTYLVSASQDMYSFDEVLLSGIAGAAGQTTVNVPLPPGRPRLFLRVERQ